MCVRCFVSHPAYFQLKHRRTTGIAVSGLITCEIDGGFRAEHARDAILDQEVNPMVDSTIQLAEVSCMVSPMALNSTTSLDMHLRMKAQASLRSTSRHCACRRQPRLLRVWQWQRRGQRLLAMAGAGQWWCRCMRMGRGVLQVMVLAAAADGGADGTLH